MRSFFVIEARATAVDACFSISKCLCSKVFRSNWVHRLLQQLLVCLFMAERTPTCAMLSLKTFCGLCSRCSGWVSCVQLLLLKKWGRGIRAEWQSIKSLLWLQLYCQFNFSVYWSRILFFLKRIKNSNLSFNVFHLDYGLLLKFHEVLQKRLKSFLKRIVMSSSWSPCQLQRCAFSDGWFCFVEKVLVRSASTRL